MKKLSEAQLRQRQTAGKVRAKAFTPEYQSQAGKKLVEKRGVAYMSQIGKKGYQVTKARYPHFERIGGIAAWKAQNRKMLDEGYFPNQSIEQWNYCRIQGCHHSRQTFSFYCSRHHP